MILGELDVQGYHRTEGGATKDSISVKIEIKITDA